jgi:hypothetical protein
VGSNPTPSANFRSIIEMGLETALVLLVFVVIVIIVLDRVRK